LDHFGEAGGGSGRRQVRAPLRAAVQRLLAEADRSAEVVLAEAKAEFSALLIGKDLRYPAAAQLARLIRGVRGSKPNHRLLRLVGV
jgi:regulator of protease activity HflC (stomatin/prohibitin superfamily)